MGPTLASSLGDQVSAALPFRSAKKSSWRAWTASQHSWLGPLTCVLVSSTPFITKGKNRGAGLAFSVLMLLATDTALGQDPELAVPGPLHTLQRVTRIPYHRVRAAILTPSSCDKTRARGNWVINKACRGALSDGPLT